MRTQKKRFPSAGLTQNTDTSRSSKTQKETEEQLKKDHSDIPYTGHHGEDLKDTKDGI